MKAAPFFLILAILLGGLIMAFNVATTSPDDTGAVAQRPTVTPRPRPTSPSDLAQSAPTSAPSQGVAEGGAVVPPVQAPQQTTPSPTSVVATPTVVPTPVPTAGPVPPTPSPTVAQTDTPATGAVLRVGNTDGTGVFLRRTPQMNDTVRAWVDNSPMVVVGPTVTGDGHSWQHVRAPDGTEGYIPVEYLIGG